MAKWPSVVIKKPRRQNSNLPTIVTPKAPLFIRPPRQMQGPGVASVWGQRAGFAAPADDLLKTGADAIADAVARCDPPVIVVEMLRNFGDVLHSTIVVRHLRKTFEGSVVWAIESKYADEFDLFLLDELGPHALARLPALPPYPQDGPYRISWVQGAARLPGVVRSFGCGPHPWGSHGRTSVADAVFANAGIANLVVPRRPCVMISQADEDWVDAFVTKHGLGRGFATLEYVSYTVSARPVEWYRQMVTQVPFPIVALAGISEPSVPGTVDARGCTYRQAKALIARSRVFVGRGSGLSILAAAEGCEQKIIDLIDNPGVALVGNGYRQRGDRYRTMPEASSAEVARAVTEWMR